MASSNQDPIEPEWRWFGAAMRKAMCMEDGHGVPYEFWCYIWDHEEEGRVRVNGAAGPAAVAIAVAGTDAAADDEDADDDDDDDASAPSGGAAQGSGDDPPGPPHSDK